MPLCELDPIIRDAVAAFEPFKVRIGTSGL